MNIGFEEKHKILGEIKEKYPEKCAPEDKVFRHINRRDRIFIGTGCGEPQYLVMIQELFELPPKHP